METFALSQVEMEVMMIKIGFYGEIIVQVVQNSIYFSI